MSQQGKGGLAPPWTPDAGVTVHATSVALAGGAVVIVGAAGSGKSGLALQLMAWGARLVADDRTALSLQGGALWASCPAGRAGLIEARGVGLLRADPAPPSRVALAVDLDQTEAERLPPVRSVRWLGRDVPLLHKAATPHFAAAILQYLIGGRIDPDQASPP